MTDVLIALATDQKPNACISERHLDEIEHTLCSNKIHYIRSTSSIIQFMLDFSLLEACQKLTTFSNYSLAGQIKLEQQILIFKIIIIDEKGLQVRAKTPYQKVSLAKHFLYLNKKNETFQFKVHPLTGELELNISIILSQQSESSWLVYQILNNLKNKSENFIRIFQLLEIIPSQSRQNNVYTKILQKIDPLQKLITGSENSELTSTTIQEQLHKKLFFCDVEKSRDLRQSINQNMIEKLKKTYVEGFSNSFIYCASKVKAYNLAYLNIEANPVLQAMIKSIQTEQYPSKINGNFTFKSQGKNIQINVKSQASEIINYQYSICDKILKRKQYFTFVKEYIMIKNSLGLHKRYILTKKSEKMEQFLNSFIVKNSLTLTLQTKLKIISQAICMAYICSQKLQNFYPSMSESNFLINQQLQLKFNSLSLSKIDPQVQLVQLIYKFMFGYYKYETVNKKLIQKSFVQVENNFLISFGPAVVMRILIKTIETFIKKTTKKALENLLLIFTRIYDSYQKMATHNSQQIQQI